MIISVLRRLLFLLPLSMAGLGCGDLEEALTPRPQPHPDRVPALQVEVPPGHSGVTLFVTGNPERSGLLSPGASVDVMMTPKGGGLTEIIVENILVIGLPEARHKRRGTPVTVAVTQAQAEQVIQGQAKGSLTLLIRGENNP